MITIVKEFGDNKYMNNNQFNYAPKRAHQKTPTVYKAVTIKYFKHYKALESRKNNRYARCVTSLYKFKKITTKEIKLARRFGLCECNQSNFGFFSMYKK